jgi:sterol desaturase/sphingolipid hydroxylase (fatty acid hydroxylase superfamily)
MDEYRTNPNVVWPWDSNPDLISSNLGTLVFNHLIVVPVVTSVALYTGMLAPRHDIDDLPTPLEAIMQLLFCIVTEDVWSAFLHRAMHTRTLYSTIHKKHHEYIVSVGIAAEHAHIVEFLTVNIGALMFGPMILRNRMHLFVLWSWLAYRVGDTVDQHGGYEFPWSPFSILPFATSAHYHDFHHTHNVGNYAS